MFPFFSAQYPSNVPCGDAILFGNDSGFSASSCGKLPYFLNLRFSQFCSALLRANASSIFPSAVLHILFLSPKEQMVRIYTKRGVALMQNANTMRNFATGSRFALVTWTDDGRRVCVGEINKFRLQFSEITVSLHNFHARLLGQRRLFPKSEERVGRQMTTLELSSQIHAILGYKRPPSNRTLRREKEAKDAADGMNGGA